ncbi:hypothetical protein BLOT_004650 [Blomia tropicalis]|nr:hypothetical protein BLOT_004650 [Blomia tropicalis]
MSTTLNVISAYDFFEFKSLATTTTTLLPPMFLHMVANNQFDGLPYHNSELLHFFINKTMIIH